MTVFILVLLIVSLLMAFRPRRKPPDQRKNKRVFWLVLLAYLLGRRRGK